MNERRLLALKNRFQGRRAFIIGNGPSLLQTDVRLLKDEVTIGCNGLFLMFDGMGFMPTFYTVEDVLVAEDRASELNQIRGVAKVFPADLRYCLRPDRDTIYINFVRNYPCFPEFSDNFASRVMFGGTVTYLNLQLAYYIGCREVYMVGVDHSYAPHTDRDELEKCTITSRSTDRSHFHPDYFGPGYRYHVPNVERMEASYRKAKEFFEANGGVVCNATVGGKLEVFPRVEFTTLFT